MKDRSKVLAVINTGKRKESSESLTTQVIKGGSGGPTPSGSYLQKSIWDKCWEIKTTPQGEEYLFGKFPIALQYSLTSFAGNDMLNFPSIYDGLPIDNQTLYWVLDENGKKVLLKAAVGGEGGGLSVEEIREIIESYNYLSEFPIASTSVKGIASFDSKSFSVRNGVVSFIGNTDLSDYVTKTEIASLENEVNANANAISNIKSTYATQAWVLEIVSEIGEGGGGIADTITWNKVIGKPTWLSDDIISYSEISGTPDLDIYALKDELPDMSDYMDLASYQTVNGKKDFKDGLFVKGQEISYDSRGFWKLEGDLVVTGGITSFANDSVYQPSTIMDGVLVDGVTIIKEEGKLVVVGGSSGGGTSENQLTVNSTGIGNAFTSYTYVGGKLTLIKGMTFATTNQLSSLASDVYTKSEIDLSLDSKWTTDTKKITNWDAAYGWGNHANAGYVKSSILTEVLDEYVKYSALTETLRGYVTIDGDETVTGKKDFTGGLFVNNQELVYNKEEGYWKMEGNLLVTGGITSYSSDGKATPFLLDSWSWDDISSSSTTQVYTARATSLLKSRLAETDANANSALEKIAILKDSLGALSAYTASALVTELKNIANSL